MLKTLRRKTIGDLKTHRSRFLAVWVVVVMGAAFYGAFYPAGKNVLASVYATYDQLRYMDFRAFFDPAPQSITDDVRKLEGVAAAEGRLVVESGVQLDPKRTFLTTLRLVTVPDSGQPAVNRNDVPNGRGIQSDDEILLLKRFADYHGIRPGDTLTVWINGQAHQFKVAGLAFNPEYLVSGRSREAPFPAPSAFGVAWLRYGALANILGAKGLINDVVISLGVKSEADSAALRAKVKAELEKTLAGQSNLSILEREQTASGGVVQANINGNFQIMAMFSALFLLVAVVITFILLGQFVGSERQRIGTLRALGITRRELVAHYLTFGLLIGATGGLVGSVAGYFISFTTIYPFVDAIAGGYLPGFANTPQIPFILLGFGILVAGTTLAGAYPAWGESGAPPGIALRPPMPRTPSAVSRLSLGFLPLFLRQTLRNILRAPGRSLATALGVMMGAVMVFAAVGLVDSMDFSFNDYFNSNRYDLRLLVAQPIPAETLEGQVKPVKGVASAQAALFGPVTVKNAGKVFDTLAFALDEKDPYIVLTTLEGAPAFSSADGVWIGHNLARVLKAGVGGTLTLTALGQTKQARVLGIVSQAFGSPVFIPRSLFTAWTPGGVALANTALVRVTGGQLADARDALAKVPGVVAVEDYPAFVKDVNNYLSFWRINSWAFAIFGILLTLAVILNTVNARLQEQQADIAILRSLGIARREIIVSVLTEILILAALGIAIGVPLGREVGAQMAHSVDMDFYGLVATLYPAAIPVCIAAIVLIVVLATIPGLRSAFNVDLGQVSKGQSV
ncbi:MAG: FtsX-like permease family protein [Anaerolineales bacterium]